MDIEDPNPTHSSPTTDMSSLCLAQSTSTKLSFNKPPTPTTLSVDSVHSLRPVFVIVHVPFRVAIDLGLVS